MREREHEHGVQIKKVIADVEDDQIARAAVEAARIATAEVRKSAPVQ